MVVGWRLWAEFNIFLDKSEKGGHSRMCTGYTYLRICVSIEQTCTHRPPDGSFSQSCWLPTVGLALF